MDFAATRNTVPLSLASVPVFDLGEFRDQVLARLAGGGRLLLLTGLPAEAKTVRLLAAIADDPRGDILLCSAIAADAYPALTPNCPAAHYFEREIHEQYSIEPYGHPWLKPVRFPPDGPTIGEADFFAVAGEEIHE